MSRLQSRKAGDPMNEVPEIETDLDIMWDEKDTKKLIIKAFHTPG